MVARFKPGEIIEYDCSLSYILKILDFNIASKQYLVKVWWNSEGWGDELYLDQYIEQRSRLLIKRSG